MAGHYATLKATTYERPCLEVSILWLSLGPCKAGRWQSLLTRVSPSKMARAEAWGHLGEGSNERSTLVYQITEGNAPRAWV